MLQHNPCHTNWLAFLDTLVSGRGNYLGGEFGWEDTHLSLSLTVKTRALPFVEPANILIGGCGFRVLPFSGCRYYVAPELS